MKLTLELFCPSYEVVDELYAELHGRGFNAWRCSPATHVWSVRISATPETVNYGTTVFDELQTAHDAAKAFFEAKGLAW